MGRVSLIPEQALPAPEHDREQQDAHLIHQVELQQRIDELRAAGDQDVAAGTFLQLRDLGCDVADDRRVVPGGLSKGGRHDVLLEVVDPVGEPMILRCGRPERRPDLVRHPPQQDRVRLEELIDLVPLLVLRCPVQGPGVLPVPMLLEPRRLHHAVERHEFRHDEATHGTSVRCTEEEGCGRRRRS